MASLALADSAVQSPGAQPAPALTTLSRQSLAITARLGPNQGATYSVDYQPNLENGGKLSPWLVRMFFTAPGAAPGSISFNWTDQTSTSSSGPTAGNIGQAVHPQIGGNMTDVPPGVDPNAIQQAVLSGGAPGTFGINVTNGSTVDTTYTLQLYPLQGGVLEPGINPNPKPVQLTAQPGSAGSGQ